MSLRIGDIAPDFEAETTQGPIRFHAWTEDAWVILFSHPKDFTPVCTTELAALASLKQEFESRNCKILGLSVDGIEDLLAWAKDIEKSHGRAPNFPLIGDSGLEIAKLYDMLPGDVDGNAEHRTAGDNATARSVFVIDPDKRIKATLTYPMSTGRNLIEILRLLDSCQLTANEQVATPANWEYGEDVFILPAVSDEEANVKYPNGWTKPLPDVRVVAQPGARKRAEQRWRWI